MSLQPGTGGSGPRVGRCPICKKSFLIENSTAMPFCSPRCKTIDLGRWLGEDYTVPGNPLDLDESADGGFGEPHDDS